MDLVIDIDHVVCRLVDPSKHVDLDRSFLTYRHPGGRHELRTLIGRGSFVSVRNSEVPYSLTLSAIGTPLFASAMKP